MALQKDISVTGNAMIEVNGTKVNVGTQSASFTAYCKVQSVAGTKDVVTFDVILTADGMNPIRENYAFTPSLDDSAPNFIKQAYQYLKTVEAYSNAVDC